MLLSKGEVFRVVHMFLKCVAMHIGDFTLVCGHHAAEKFKLRPSAFFRCLCYKPCEKLIICVLKGVISSAMGMLAQSADCSCSTGRVRMDLYKVERCP